MLKSVKFLILTFILPFMVAQRIEENFCSTYPTALQCVIEGKEGELPQNFDCDPFTEGEKCAINDLIREDIAACRTESADRKGLKGDFGVNP